VLSDNPWVRMWQHLPPLKYFILMGFLESTGNILQILGTSYLSGPMISLLSQTTIFFSMVVSIVMFQTKYSILQVMSVFFVVGGAMIPLVHEIMSSETHSTTVPFEYYVIMSIASFPLCISFALKEMIFKREKELDIFVVNSTSSMFQILWWPVALPITIWLGQTAGMPIKIYLKAAWTCFTGGEPDDDFNIDCHINPYPYLIYVALNLLFNVFLLLLIKRASAVQSFMALNGVLPASVLLFCISWPLIGSSPLDVFVVASLLIVMCGLIWNRILTIQELAKKARRSDSTVNN